MSDINKGDLVCTFPDLCQSMPKGGDAEEMESSVDLVGSWLEDWVQLEASRTTAVKTSILSFLYLKFILF